MGGVRALRVYSRITGAPAPEVFHTNEGHAGFLGIERIRELTVDEGGPGTRLRHRARGHRAPARSSPRTRRCPRASTASRASSSQQYFGGELADPGRARRPGARARRRGLRRRRRRRLQHGGDGLPPRPARQRRLPAARPRVARHVQRPVAGLRRGRGADRLDHQRRPRPDLDRARGLRPRRRAAAPTSTATTPTPCGRWSTRSATASIWDLKRTLRDPLVDDARVRLRQARRPSAASRRPSSAGSTTALDPDVLTIGFARRVPSYKRLTLMLRDPARLKRLLLDPERPDPAGHRRQVAPGRRRRQEAHPGDGALRRRPGGPAPHRRSCPTTTSPWRSRSTPAATSGSTTRCAPTRRAARPA